MSSPPTVTASTLNQPYDLIILSCKAYDLEAAIIDIAPAVGPATRILPLLNGMLHMDMLDHRFGPNRVLGGLCMISTTLNASGEIIHSGQLQSLTFGARDVENENFAKAVEAQFAGTGILVVRSNLIMQEMWEKWVFIATAAGLTSLMRAPIGDIVEAGGSDIAEKLLQECSVIAELNGHVPRGDVLKRFRKMFTTRESLMTASLFRDLETGSRIEADHLLGDLLARASTDKDKALVLRVAYVHMKTYEARKRRENNSILPTLPTQRLLRSE
jgi:2-dehydropantoate 2-reductase